MKFLSEYLIFFTPTGGVFKSTPELMIIGGIVIVVLHYSLLFCIKFPVRGGGVCFPENRPYRRILFASPTQYAL